MLRIHKIDKPFQTGILRLLCNKTLSIAIVAILINCSGYLKAQEKLQALTQNTQLQVQDKQKTKLKSVTAQSLQLPVIDDFSSTNMFPDPRIWADNNVFVNNSFAVNPKTVGVATFDIFDSNGKIYDIATGIGFGADTLTSNPINLSYNKESNIRLSFYYQPGGLGDIPDAKDSLTLQFYAPASKKWLPVWFTPGYDTLMSFTYKNILINDTAFLKDGFRFRFINYATLTPTDIAGKTSIPDLWNLDYVKLDKNRAENDSVYEDIAMIKPLSSLLKTYNAMPWSHYLFAFIQEIKPKVEMTYKIYNPKGLTVDRKFTFKELHTNYPADTLNMGGEINDPWQNIYKDYDLTNPFKSRNKDSAIYEVHSFISIEDTINKYKYNDTAKFTQVFTNYFAYDDGNAESGYGISGQGTENAEAAYRFYSYFPDTLRSIAILFNPSQDNDTIYFRLAVWDNNNGKPGNLIYKDTWERTPIVKSRNEFAYYTLDSGIRVNETFFIGWEQSSDGFLNIGYDLNSTNGQRFLFYNINGTWEQSGSSGNVRPGSLMLRPIMRTQKSSTVSAPIIKDNTGISVFPNPATDDLTITKDGKDNDKIIRVTFYNVTGQAVKTVELPEQTIRITDLKPGLYILTVQTQKGNVKTIKLLKEM